ncbi:hypothetical protein FGO68_gene2851 [Halteria grandinella]|uniref:Uncharacterized protein n=1 Tax=Halteria grandinella TaxID=5974 RepID=A0A8J8T9D3_HALGN|nr:hypothetical protein FGO68_gene2851 [Halteria grandinella]
MSQFEKYLMPELFCLCSLTIVQLDQMMQSNGIIIAAIIVAILVKESLDEMLEKLVIKLSTFQLKFYQLQYQ